MFSLMDEFEMGDEPTTCPKCGARTTFDESEDGIQVHHCPECWYAFAVDSTN